MSENNNADKENQPNDEINFNSVKLEEIKNPFEGNKVLEDIGARHLDLYDRRFLFQTNIDSRMRETPYNHKIHDEYRRQKGILEMDLRYLQRLLDVRDRYIKLIENGRYDGVKMTKEDFMEILGIDEREYYGIAYSVFMFGTDETPFENL
ncbi:hypothetical protein [Priestia megaterium]|uniref:Uncharacterized protein n=1 Tax=Priestia megaterium TaxID=1404 RepID=A0A6M6E056_PRIMG|nr:hypothetical protein [Priestia megaterium]QJX80230.1 hypothetical protein FDZ14_29475 [Priestia megaterium]